MRTLPKCLRCSTEMERGFILDRSDADALVARWVAGSPELAVLAEGKVKGKAQRKTETYRCPGCGYLESYAGEMEG